MASKFDISEFAKTLPSVPDLGTEEMQWIETWRILDNPRNFYPRPNNADLAELMESIQANGLIEPPTVVPDDGQGFRLISGHSRMEAIRTLQSADPTDERWDKVLCRVLPPMTEEQEVGAVIEANRQRKKSPALLQQEAEKLTESYVARKKAGEDLPGRIRDRVAESMKISKTKLSNLNAIKAGLKVPGFQRMWAEEKITESAALEIARMDLDTQYRLLDWHIEKGRALTLQEVRKFNTIWIGLPHKCPGTAGLCPNAERMYDAFFFNGEWHCPGCCRSCLKKDDCAKSCGYVEKKPQEIVETPKPAMNPAISDPRLKWERMGKTFCGRVTALREATGMSREEFAESIAEFSGTYSAWENASLPGSERVAKLALCLGCSTDYLYGLTDEPTPQMPAPVGWRPLDKDHWPQEGQLVVLSFETSLGGSGYQLARCVAGYHDQYPFIDPDTALSVEDIVELECDRWLPFPEAQRGNGEKHD